MKKIKKTIALSKDNYDLLIDIRKKYAAGHAPEADIKQTLSQVDKTMPTISGIFERALNLFYTMAINPGTIYLMNLNEEPITKMQTIYLTPIANKKYNEMLVRFDCKPVDLVNDLIRFIYAQK